MAIRENAIVRHLQGFTFQDRRLPPRCRDQHMESPQRFEKADLEHVLCAGESQRRADGWVVWSVSFYKVGRKHKLRGQFVSNVNVEHLGASGKVEFHHVEFHDTPDRHLAFPSCTSANLML